MRKNRLVLSQRRTCPRYSCEYAPGDFLRPITRDFRHRDRPVRKLRSISAGPCGDGSVDIHLKPQPGQAFILPEPKEPKGDRLVSHRRKGEEHV